MDGEQRLSKINSLSLSLRSIWLGLLVALVFVGITLMGHRDADFFAYGAATTLPFVNVAVHPAAFFLAAPVLIAAIFIYLHAFLLSLWDHIGDADATYGSNDTPLSDHIAPTIFGVAAVWYRNRFRADGSMAPSVLGAWFVAIALSLGWGFGLIILCMIWAQGMPLHDFWVTVVSAISLWAATVVAGLSLRSADGGLRGRSRTSLATVQPTTFVISGVLFLVVVFTSWERTKGGILAGLGVPAAFQIPLATADLRDTNLTKRPANWQPFELWLTTIGADRPGTPAERDGIARLWQNRLRSLEAPDLSGRDLRGADLRGAFLPGVNLRNADLTGAQMQGASLEGADFRRSRFELVDLKHAALQGAVLSGLKIFGSDFSFSLMEYSDLFSSRILDSRFSHANLSYADFGVTLILGSDLQKANLTDARFDGAAAVRSFFAGATFARANLDGFLASDTGLQDVDFSSANLTHSSFLDADLTFAKFSADTFEQTCFIRSNLSGSGFELGVAELERELAERLDLTGSNLLAADLSELAGILTESTITPAYGGDATNLPPDVALPAHWMVGGVGVVGGGAYAVLDPPWSTRTRQQMDSTNAALDTNSRAYVVGGGWRDWLEGLPTEQEPSFWCDRAFLGDSESAGNVLDAFQIDYQGLGGDIDHILSPDWYSVLDDAFP
ncbi:pentapeptide repeat-containing protein [Roseovarius sp. D22-M7]|uniref:pentapeptide repeat-containing protein n=1 Tax=Roseovarius sp. D22-M7 TaxID=3127116 RepID=UPI00300F9E52